MKEETTNPSSCVTSNAAVRNRKGTPGVRCVECGSDSGPLARQRCRPCYRRHVALLKKAGAFVSLNEERQGARWQLATNSEVAPNGCIYWTGRLGRGNYGDLQVAGKHWRAHRLAYEVFVGPIPEGAQVDHTCHNASETCAGGEECLHRRCINPEHLEAVSGQENTLRAPHAPAAINARKTECDHGHPFDTANTYIAPNGSRKCRRCRVAAGLRWERRVREERNLSETHVPTARTAAGSYTRKTLDAAIEADANDSDRWLPTLPGQRRSPEQPQPKVPGQRTGAYDDIVLRFGEHAANGCF